MMLALILSYYVAFAEALLAVLVALSPFVLLMLAYVTLSEGWGWWRWSER